MISCPTCKLEHDDRALVCEHCQALLHREELQQHYAAAREAEGRQEWTAAATHLARCLEMLPPETRQHQQVTERLSRSLHFARLSGTAPAGHPPPASPGAVAATAPPRNETAAQAATEPCGEATIPPPAGLVRTLVDSLQLLLGGLSQPRTLISMAIWIITLSWLVGWRRALAFGGMVYVHEMGHIVMIRRQGFAFSWPLFVPFLGAFVLQGKASPSARQDAGISLAGPLAGMSVSALIVAVDLFHGVPGLVRELGFINALINLMNLLPFWVLDGGRIAACASRRQVLIVGLIIGAFGVYPFSPFAWLMCGGYLIRAWFWRDFEAVQPARSRPRLDRGHDMQRALGVLLAAVVGCCWMMRLLKP